MTAVATPLPSSYSAEEYFNYRKDNEGRFEYHDGKIYAMAGGTIEHSRIKTDTTRVLGNMTLEGPCEPLDSDMAVFIPNYNHYVLPDVSFVCGKPVMDGRTRLLNPTLLIEVISESSEAYDRGEKFWKYRSLDSFKEYMLIDSRRYAVEKWYKQDEKIWRMDSAFARSESIHLHTLDVHLPLSEIYRRVAFED